MRAAAEKHLEEATAFIAVAESGDAKQAAYRRAAEEIDAAKQADPTLTNVEIGRRLGKSQNYAKALLDALSRAREGEGFQIDWGNSGRYRAQVGAQKIAREQPDAFVGAYRQAPPKVQREIAKQIAAEPFIGQEVSRRNAEERKRQVEAATKRREGEAMPLPAYMARMVVKMNEWSAALAELSDELDTLPEGRGREMVLDAARQLAMQADHWVDRLQRHPKMGDVVEGRVAS